MDTNKIDLEADAGVEKIASDELLNTVSSLIEMQVAAERHVEQSEGILKEAKENLKNIKEERLPEAMRSAGVVEFTTTDFYHVSLHDAYYANIKIENQDAAFTWLKEMGHDDIIKNDVNVSFGRGEEVMAHNAMATLTQLGFNPTNKKHIHWQTLRAFVKEQMIKGVTLPEAIDVHVIPTTRIKRK